MKICTSCKVPKEFIEFSKSCITKTGFKSACKLCCSLADKKKGEDGLTGGQRWGRRIGVDGLTNRQRTDRKVRADGLNSAQRSAMNKLKKHYGITLEEWDERMLNQGGACEICSRDFKKTPNVDHNHQTGKVRALLCRNCNVAIGHMMDSAGIAQKAADYLKRFS